MDSLPVDWLAVDSSMAHKGPELRDHYNPYDLIIGRNMGRIPLGTQLQSFDASTYNGNVRLCGPPLTPTCPGDEALHVPPGIGDNREDQEEGDTVWRWFYISMSIEFIVGFWGFCGPLLLISPWRHAYFNLLDNLEIWLYTTRIV
ncbi:unnamed protein product [Ilex paraguariensis]|uniref:Uncharacterized protein n=1 Tax=Ilex paraguariensis TaxID=185542 RepID=A0ABC8RRJ1_9AQUA